jgi:hypothetical protein
MIWIGLSTCGAHQGIWAAAGRDVSYMLAWTPHDRSGYGTTIHMRAEWARLRPRSGAPSARDVALHYHERMQGCSTVASGGPSACLHHTHFHACAPAHPPEARARSIAQRIKCTGFVHEKEWQHLTLTTANNHNAMCSRVHPGQSSCLVDQAQAVLLEGFCSHQAAAAPNTSSVGECF